MGMKPTFLVQTFVLKRKALRARGAAACAD